MLDAPVLRFICDTVLGITLLQLKFALALRTGSMVGQVASRHFRVHLSHSSVCRLLTQIYASPQRPL